MDDAHYDLLAQVASLYYEHEMTQQEIARELGLSRVKIYRLLKEARDEQVVQITINWRIRRSAALERALVETFGLHDALVLQTAPASGEVARLANLGRLTAQALEKLLHDGTTLAICLGRSTYEVISAIHPGFQADVTVVQAIGSMPVALHELDSAELVRQLGQKLGGEVVYLSAPPLADSPEAAAVLRSQRGIRQALEAARRAEIALVGIGNLDPAAMSFARAGYISAAELAAMQAEGIAGEMAGWAYDIEGRTRPTDFSDRLIGITLDELRGIPLTIAVARGEPKATAILGALRTGAVDVLATDDETAQAVLARASQA